ncbi:MAG TPA: sugar kinase [Bacteroidales bacterium]|nr:sugar kinase [Bacteroidales bacterium]HRW94826.1 sugar kinase [Bacteroidales bacterium]
MGKVVTFGEIMLRLAVPDHLRLGQSGVFSATFGGGEANVAVSLANYGTPASFITRLPDNDLGLWCIKELRSHRIHTDGIIQGGKRLGLYYLETGADARASKVIYDRENSSFSEIDPQMISWETIFRDATWFHWTGITPAVSRSAAQTCLDAIKTANRMGITVSCDLNFRKNLWKYGSPASEVMPELVSGCDIIIGNEEDAERIFNIKPEGYKASRGITEADAFKPVCESLMNKFPKAGKVAITLRGSLSASHNTWSAILWNKEKMHTAPVYDITHIVDRVGGGDAFAAGLIYGLITYPGDDARALDFATAASCLKHSIYGDFNRVSVQEIETLMVGDASGRVNR